MNENVLTAAVRLRYKLKKRQVKMLKRFATTMKWPNLAETLDNLRARDEDFSLDTISSDAFAYFSGLILPGVRPPRSLEPTPLVSRQRLTRRSRPSPFSP